MLVSSPSGKPALAILNRFVDFISTRLKLFGEYRYFLFDFAGNTIVVVVYKGIGWAT